MAARDFVLVFDFGFGQCGLAVQAPVHRLAALVQVTALVDLAERADDVRFVPEIHGQVGMIPVADDVEADEIFLLALDLCLRIFAA